MTTRFLFSTLLLPVALHAAATITISNINGPGVGFNDATPAVPVGGNPGITLGQQRLIAFSHAANIWGATLTSATPIVVNAQFSALTCSATGAVLGSAGATRVYRDWAGVPKTATWYSYALANKLFGSEIDSSPIPQISSNFNVNLGTPGCLPLSPWYFGLDSNEPAGQIDFVAVLLHEMGHGLGFQTFTSGSTGNFFASFPSVWDHFLLDATSGVLWKDATPAQRIASAISLDKLVWTGANVNAAAPSVLRQGLAGTAVSGPAAGALAGTTLNAGEASFGAPLTLGGLTGELMPVSTPATGAACTVLSLNDARAVNGKIALVDRGSCGFAVKAKNVQNAGAIGIIIANNVAGLAPGLGGTDPTVVIRASSVSLSDGKALKTQLATRSRTNSGVFVRMGLFGTQLAGADALGRVKMFAPNPFQGGSSVSHYDTTASRNQLMEPSINGDLTQSVMPPIDLSLPLFTDIGW